MSLRADILNFVTLGTQQLHTLYCGKLLFVRGNQSEESWLKESGTGTGMDELGSCTKAQYTASKTVTGKHIKLLLQRPRKGDIGPL